MKIVSEDANQSVLVLGHSGDDSDEGEANQEGEELEVAVPRRL